MFPTPSEIREAKLPRSVRGYDPDATRRLLERVAASYEAACEERDGLRAQVEKLESEAARFRETERLLADTLLVAQRTAEELKEQARVEAEATIEEARAAARDHVAESEAAARSLRDEIERLRREERDVRGRFGDFLRATMARWQQTAPESGDRALLDDLAPTVSRSSGQATAADPDA